MKVRDPAVSSVISEMLIISIVIILIPMVTITLMYQLPDSREPTVNIKMSSIIDGKVDIVHKGGDTIRVEDIRIIVKKEERNIRDYFNPDNGVFDVGDKISVPINENGDVSLIIKNTVFPLGKV
jgi:hypothetical protein